jgi:prevent-host-death family protein
MTEIGAYEAKTRLSELLEKVREGKSFTITRHGHPIAELRPVGQRPAAQRKALVERMKRFQAEHRLDAKRIRGLVNEGRRY